MTSRLHHHHHHHHHHYDDVQHKDDDEDVKQQIINKLSLLTCQVQTTSSQSPVYL